MAEDREPLILHPSVLIAAVLPDSPQSAWANRLLGDVAMGRCIAHVIGDSALLEFHALSTLIATQALSGFSVEDLANVLRDLRQQLAEANLYGGLRAELFEPYRLAATVIAVNQGLDLYTALLVTAAGTKGGPWCSTMRLSTTGFSSWLSRNQGFASSGFRITPNALVKVDGS